MRRVTPRGFAPRGVQFGKASRQHRCEPLSTGHDPLLGDPPVRVPHTHSWLSHLC